MKLSNTANIMLILICHAMAIFTFNFLFRFSICTIKALNLSSGPYSPDRGQQSILWASVRLDCVKILFLFYCIGKYSLLRFYIQWATVYVFFFLTLWPVGNVCYCEIILAYIRDLSQKYISRNTSMYMSDRRLGSDMKSA